MPLGRKVGVGALAALILFSLWAVLFRVDLTPRVESDFFFSSEDSAFQASRQIEERFPSQPQLILSVRGEDTGADSYVQGIKALSEDLAMEPGVTSVQSLTSGPSFSGDVANSPFWSRLLLTEDPHFTQLVVSVDEPTDPDFVARIERIVAFHHADDFQIAVSGVPFVVELIRRHLLRDLRVFSTAAIGVFGLVILIVYRSWPLVVGTLLSCLGACLLTLTALHLIGTPIGILTANIATIVFVLTLSHTVFLTSNWRRLHATLGREAAVERAVRITFVASFWCMVAALLGFGSLLLASAKPLRELGVSGVTGTLVAIVVAYGFYPLFLGFGRPAASRTRDRRGSSRLPGGWGTVVALSLVVLAALGLPRIETDPSLLTYFSAGSEIREGLELIDAQRGSSPLYLVVQDPEGERLDTRKHAKRLAELQGLIEEDPRVGVSLSLAVLLEEARRIPFVGLFPPDKIVNVLDSDRYQHIARSFLSEERTEALYFLRMREEGRQEPRRAVVERLDGMVESSGLETTLVGGLYDLQGQMGELVRASLGRELGGLLFFFVFVAAAVSRSARTTVGMVACLAAVPILLLGAVGHLGQPVDVISAPGTNVAIALGIDAMIHLLMAVRRRRSAGDVGVAVWANACAQQRPAIVGAMSILAAGFGIFVLSSFPPTRRFGILVAVGSLASAAMALKVLPFLATAGDKRASEES